MPKKVQEEEPEYLDDAESEISTSAALERAQAIEQERERKKKERLKKKSARQLKKSRELKEKLVAPILLIITVIVSAILYLLG